MKAWEFIAKVDDQHRLQLEFPPSAGSGPVRVLVLLPEPLEESPEVAGEVEAVWMQAIAREWQGELADLREDIYRLEDGDPIASV